MHAPAIPAVDADREIRLRRCRLCNQDRNAKICSRVTPDASSMPIGRKKLLGDRVDDGND